MSKIIEIIEMVESLIDGTDWTVHDNGEVRPSVGSVWVNRTSCGDINILIMIHLLENGGFQVFESIEHRLSGPYDDDLGFCGDLNQLRCKLLNRIKFIDNRYEK